jgi:hypothetical protein
MKIFKELKKLGYIHYSATTIEELDDLPLNSAERVSEQALVFKWFREKHEIDSHVIRDYSLREVPKQYCYMIESEDGFEESKNFDTHEKAELACLKKLIEIVKQKQNA